ncbi:unnamed protein product [Phytophthora lilii]|uniref:Unnamed protein product n=1 Tax=Phytophthora lilii TaxID=2077276 RepID=A0A9W6U8F9_9STRA|nr:unnamed protein product [Phytophthora lilii]
MLGEVCPCRSCAFRSKQMSSPALTRESTRAQHTNSVSDRNKRLVAAEYQASASKSEIPNRMLPGRTRAATPSIPTPRKSKAAPRAQRSTGSYDVSGDPDENFSEVITRALRGYQSYQLNHVELELNTRSNVCLDLSSSLSRSKHAFQRV